MVQGSSNGDSRRTLYGGHPLDVVFRALADAHRRHVLSCLLEHHTLSLADLADELAEREHGARIDVIPADDVMQHYLSLYHTHVPKLEDADLIEYDQATDTVMLADDIGHVEPFLDLATGDTGRTDGNDRAG